MLAIFAILHYPTIKPVVVRIGPVAIRWYGLAYVTGFLVASWMLGLMLRRRLLRISRESLDILIGWLVFGVIIGGRTGWWLFYHRSSGRPEPWYEPFALWHGGMSFHGGLIGVATSLTLWCWLNKSSLGNTADAVALVSPIGLCLGRLANFINAELVGRPTAVPWGTIFPGDNVVRHPSQLYEAILEGPLLLSVLWVVYRKVGPRDGRTAALFVVAYGVFRFAVEFTREPHDQVGFIAFGWLTMGQLLSAAITVIGLLIIVSPSAWWGSSSRDAPVMK